MSQWSAGDFQAVPEIVLLSNADINGALGAYAQSTGKIYLNADWFATATQEAVNAVLTEELGHHLDGLLNTVDTPGDEGEYFAGLLKAYGMVSAKQRLHLRSENDQGTVLVNGEVLTVEQATVIRTPISVTLPGRTNREYKNNGAFAALRADGSVVTWGGPGYGSDSSAVAADLASGVTQIFSSYSAFAALKANGSVVTWGDWGGDSSAVASSLTSGVNEIFSNEGAFAALKGDGSVVTWGYGWGGDSSAVASSLTSGVTQIFSTWGSFAALKADGSVVTWGLSNTGGDSSAVAASLDSGVTNIFSNQWAFAALKSDGSVHTWGDSRRGADSSAVVASLGSGVTEIFSSVFSFAALKADGSVVTSGDPSYGGDSSTVATRISSGVTQIFSTYFGFAALKDDGSVVTWGDPSFGGDSSTVATRISSGVTQVFSNNVAFAALKDDGSVVTWGDPNRGGDSSAVASSLNSGVTQIFSTLTAFAALKSDGSLITWGDPDRGGDSSRVADALASGVTQVFSNASAFVALKTYGSVITWGIGGGGAASNQLANVVAMANPFTDDRLVIFNQSNTEITLYSSGILENSVTGTLIGTLSPTDPGTGSSLNYSLVTENGSSDADNALVEIINGNEVRVKAGALIDFESNPILNINFLIADNGTPGRSYTQAVTAAVLNLQEGCSMDTIISSDEGIFQEGVTLTAGQLSDPDTITSTPTYTWYLGSNAVQTSTSNSYAVGPLGEGTYRVEASYTDGTGSTVTASSATQVVSKKDNAPGNLSAISGNGVFNEGVTLLAGSVSDDPDGIAVNPAYFYQWYLNNAAITGAIGSTHTVGAQGTGTYMVAVTYTDKQGYSTTLNSADQVVNKIDNAQGILSAITANGALTEGVTLTAGTISGDPDGTAVNPATTYQWFRNGTAISAATSASYLVPTTGAGTYTVQVSYRDGQDYLTTLTSTATVVTAPPPPSDTTAPTLSSIAVQGTAVILTFSEAVSASSVLATAFSVQTVSSNNTATNRTITNVALDQNSSNKVILTLSGTAPASNVNLRVSYTDPAGNQTSGVVQDQAGNDLASFVNVFADTFITASTTTLANQYKNLILTGNGSVNGTGNALNNTITGNSGNNTLSGLAGADSMAGGLGNDVYVVDNIGDVVTEDLNAGTDTVHSSVTYTLGANVENLTLTGGSVINGTGNALNNVLTGNSAVNNLSGGDGSDTLIGGGGADILTGLAGADTFRFALADSRLAAFDRITDFTIGTDILDGPNAVTAANLKDNVGTINGGALTAAAIQSVLTTTTFVRNGASTFTWVDGTTTRTFLALNDSTAGFQAANDGLIEITGVDRALLGSLAVV